MFPKMAIHMFNHFPWNYVLNMAEIHRQRKFAIEQNFL